MAARCPRVMPHVRPGRVRAATEYVVIHSTIIDLARVHPMMETDGGPDGDRLVFRTHAGYQP